MIDDTKEEILSELRAYKAANPNWQTDQKSSVVASYNNRLASLSARGICIQLTPYVKISCLRTRYV